MQVSATLIAAQQAAREAQARFQTTQVARSPTASPQASFAAALDKTEGGKAEGFAPLPFSQTAAAPPRPAQATDQPTRLGALLDIKV